MEVGEASLSDLGSKNGTFLNGRRIHTRERLADGDEIRLGSMRLRLRKLRPAASTETEAPDGE